ncbi:MAG: hypothetical protein KGP28_05200 [Bdellovibrionales bacterium]|nr:hypothetical protein [Bdellovibrionales bacterium]
MNEPRTDSQSGSSLQTSGRKKLSLLIVQMGEVDEVFRSLMALKAIKHLYPEVSIHVASRRGNSDPFKRVEWIDSVLDTPKFQKGEDPVVKVALWIDQVILRNYDILVNWTGDPKRIRVASILTSLIPAAVKLGDHVAEDLSIHSYDGWSMYRNAWAGKNVEQDIHQTDLITTQLLTALQIHSGDPAPESAMNSVSSKFFFKAVNPALPAVWLDRPKGLKWIAVHADSMSERIAEWIEMVLRRHPDQGIVLVGDRPGFEIAANSRVVDLRGGIHFDSMISIFSNCGWLVSGEHPIVDLASLLNLRIFYAAPAGSREFSLKWTERGPYGNGHIAISSREEWKPEVAYAAWSYFQSEWFHKNRLTIHGHFENLSMSAALQEIQVFRSRIRPANEGGGVSYEPIAGVVQEFESWIYRVRGQIARGWFCGWLPGVEEEVSKLTLSPALVRRIRALNDSVIVIEQLGSQGRSTAIALEKHAKNMKSGYLMSVEDRTEIEEAGKKLLEIEGLIERVAQVEPELECLLGWYRQMIHNLESQSLAGMARETADAFDLVLEGVDLISAYTKKTLDLAKPKAITSGVVGTRELDS